MDSGGFDVVQQTESVAITYGREYDFDKVFSAYIGLIEIITTASGGPAWIKPTPWAYGVNSRVSLNAGKLREVWNRIRERYQVCDYHISHVIGGATFQVYLLGRTRLVCNLSDHSLRIDGSKHLIGYSAGVNGGTKVSALEASPEIEIFGQTDSKGKVHGVPFIVVDRIRSCLEGSLRVYGMSFEYVEVEKDKYMGLINFPFKRFRAHKHGYGHVRVRCRVQGILNPGTTTA